jgi:hypothetical protein
MVAGRSFWSHNEECTAQHQPRRSGDLGVETVIEDRLCTREARGLTTGVEPSREVNEEDDDKAEQAEGEDDPAQSAPAFIAQCGEPQQRRKQGNRDK